MIPNGSHLRNQLIQSGFTPDQLNMVDAVLAETYFAKDENDRDLYEYHDSLRIARVNNDAEVKEYNHIKDHGCCGFFDRVINCHDGDILIGFNYGH